jgi:hypothetical protein
MQNHSRCPGKVSFLDDTAAFYKILAEFVLMVYPEGTQSGARLNRPRIRQNASLIKIHSRQILVYSCRVIG